MRKVLFTGLLSLIFLAGRAQTITHFTPDKLDTVVNYGYFNFIGARLHYGPDISSSPNLNSIIKGTDFLAFDLRIGWQSTGREVWERKLAYPQYGFGFSAYILDTEDIREIEHTLGVPIGIYGFASLPLVRAKRFYALNFEMAAGITTDFHPYDPEKNPQNDLIGSRVTVYIDFGLSNYFTISPRTDLQLGLNLIHFSNGRTRTPNIGINLAGVHAGMRYHFNPISRYLRQVDPDAELRVRPEFVKKEDPPYRKHWTGKFFYAAGWATTLLRDEPNRAGPAYFVSSVGAELHRHYGYVGSFGAALNWHYDASIPVDDPDMDGDAATFLDKSTIGLAALHSFYIERFSLITQVGYYVFKRTDVRGSLYARLGLRYEFSPSLWAQVALKTQDGAKADYIEWGIGYTLF